MIEVVFEESSKNTMKIAKAYKNGESIKGSGKDVVYIGTFLDIGDISEDLNSPFRKKIFKNLYSHIYDEKELEQFFYNEYKDLEKLLSAAKNKAKIRIWKSNTAHSACVLAYISYKLRNIDCEITIVSLPERHKLAKDTIHFFTSWQEVVPERLHKFLSFERELSDIEKRMESDLWKNLKEENAPLRAIINGRLISVSEDFYDQFIIRNIPDGEFLMGQLIGSLVNKYQLGVSDLWYRLRIKEMIESGKIKIISYEKPSHPYEIILRKANS